MSDLAKLFQHTPAVPENTPLINSADLFDADGVLIPQPALFWESKRREEKVLFGHTHGLYAFPTTELIGTVKRIIDGRRAIEIGAGNGGYARALAIPATDNHQQADPKFTRIYQLAGHPTINYGPHVEKLDATLAVAKYQPNVVLACWVTHLYDPRRHELGGNVIGVDEQSIMEAVDDYIFIGNTDVHSSKPLLQDLHNGLIATHTVAEYVVGQPMLQSRAARGSEFLLRLTRK